MKFAESVQKIIEKSADHYMDEQELDVSDWYDEVYHAESGRTFYQQAILELHNRWKNQNRSYMKEIGTVTKDGNELHVIPKISGRWVGRKILSDELRQVNNSERCKMPYFDDGIYACGDHIGPRNSGWESLDFGRWVINGSYVPR